MMAQFLLKLKTLLLLSLTATLVACGAGSVKDPFIPNRVVVFGDAMSDLTLGAQYTVNGDTSSTVLNWASQIAASYGVTKIVSKAAGNATLSDVTAQTTGFSYQEGDLVIISAGYRDLINEAEAGNPIATATANATALGDAYANLVRSMISAGAKHIAVANVYNLSKTPYQSLAGKTAYPLSALTRAFNDALKSNFGNLTNPVSGTVVVAVDTEAYMNLVSGLPANYGFTDSTSYVCGGAAIDATNGLGIGTGYANSKLCTTSTVVTPATASTFNSYVFADPIYPTPAFHRAYGTYAYGLIAARF